MAKQHSRAGQDETDELLDRLIQAREFLVTTAQTDTPLYQLIERAIHSMDLPLLREAANRAALQGRL